MTRWNLAPIERVCRQLGIQNPLSQRYQGRCHGQPRCRKTILDNEKSTVDALSELAFNEDVTEETLEILADTLLCEKHKSQVSSLLEEWDSRVGGHAPKWYESAYQDDSDEDNDDESEVDNDDEGLYKYRERPRSTAEKTNDSIGASGQKVLNHHSTAFSPQSIQVCVDQILSNINVGAIVSEALRPRENLTPVLLPGNVPPSVDLVDSSKLSAPKDMLSAKEDNIEISGQAQAASGQESMKHEETDIDTTQSITAGPPSLMSDNGQPSSPDTTMNSALPPIGTRKEPDENENAECNNRALSACLIGSAGVATNPDATHNTSRHPVPDTKPTSKHSETIQVRYTQMFLIVTFTAVLSKSLGRNA